MPRASSLSSYRFLAGSDHASSSHRGWDAGFDDIKTLGGSDTVKGKSSYNTGVNIYGAGSIDTGYGDDTIAGTSSGLYTSGIRNHGEILCGYGNDTVIGASTGIGGGIENLDLGLIDTGDGNDVVTGTTSWKDYAGIHNDGTISTGRGNDVIDTIGGFGGFGVYKMGRGGDTLKGFGPGWFYGDQGTDKILLRDGIYEIFATNEYSRHGVKTSIVKNDVSMSIYGFELIGGVDGGLFALREGTLTVANGIAMLN